MEDKQRYLFLLEQSRLEEEGMSAEKIIEIIKYIETAELKAQ